jgi:class I fructose-bisphosphate aldolase
MKPISFSKISTKGKFLFLSYDQGLEHGPTDFNDKNVDPKYIIDIAKKGKYNAVVFQKGIAEKYQNEIKKSKIPLIVKLNGKTGLVKGDPVSAQLTSVSEALKLGAKAVGYTIYIGSIHESEMLAQFEQIEREAHAKGIPVVAWIYPRGKSIEGKKESELMAYATRVGLEIGADIIKIHPVGNLNDFKWAVKSAGKAKVVSAGGHKTSEKELLIEIKNYMKAGFSGMAIGRNVWQNKNPLELTKKIKKVIWGKN